MRILEVSFSNLNSLLGQWRIDFRHPEFTREGIFAITGPTGAGKTTILDAMCLALYACTPRLGKLGGKSGNDIMSRQSGACEARVMFETAQGRFVSHWSQHRARKRPSGELQSPRHEVSDAATGRILASSLKDSAALIVELTGMGFEQFSRSMMLAQGAFAAFLQAGSQDRAPILEQITGSEIYSQISMMVHEQRGQERSRLEALQAELDGMPVIDAAVRKELEDQIRVLGVRAESTQTALTSVRDRLQTVQMIEDIARKMRDNDARFQLHQQRAVGFEPEQLRLRAAQRVQEIVPDYRALQSARRDHAADQLSLQACQQKIPALTQAVELAQAEVSRTQQILEVQREVSGRMQPVLEQARDLDQAIATASTHVQAQQSARLELEGAISTLDAQARERSDQLLVANAQLTRIRGQLQTNQADAELVSELSVIRKELDRLSEIDDDLAKARRSVESLTAERSRKEAALEQAKSTCMQAEGAHQVLMDQLASVAQHLESCLQGQTIEQWQVLQADLRSRLSICERASERHDTIETLDSDLARDQKQLADLQHRVAELTLTAQQYEREVTLRKEQLEGLQQQWLLLRRIEDYEQARQHLHAGDPCPLCGSLEHPFAEGSTPGTDQLRSQLDACQQALDHTVRVQNRSHLELQKVLQEITQIQHRQSRQVESLTNHRKIMADLLEQSGLTHLPMGRSVKQVLADLTAQVNAQAEAIASRLKQAVTLSEQHQQLTAQIQKSAQQLDQVRAAISQSQQQAEQARFHLDQAVVAQEQAHSQRELIAADLVHRLAPFDVKPEVLDDRANTVEVARTLSERRQRWLDLQQALVDAQHAIPRIEDALHHIQATRAAKVLECNALDQTLQQRRAQSDQWMSQRKALLGLEDTKAAARRIAQDVESALQACEQARESLARAQTALQQENSRQDIIAERLGQQAQRMAELSQTLVVWLARHGFEDEEALLKALLTDEQRQHLEAQELALLQEQSALQAARASLIQEKAQLESMLSSVEGDLLPDPVTLQRQIQELEQTGRQISETLGGLRQRLADDDRAQLECASQLERIRLQTEVYDRWNALHALIGSADGKKFRTFAQGLTFEIVIQHANRQLQRMTDRYVLVRGVQEPLELNVVDQYQAGEVRTTKNLSGGESFLVSLALALGLSKMASRNVRVDSLFLDEGFGTLDEDALDMALQTLSSLQQEGKLIGVISHVQALKDRIATQIQVTPARGGHSVLSGPGCERIQG